MSENKILDKVVFFLSTFKNLNCMTQSDLKELQETPKIGEGIYLTPDVAKILNLKYSKVYNLMKGYWLAYSFGEDGNKAVNFYSLIEFYVFFQCRQNGMSAQKFKKFHKQLSNNLQTKYPFAHYKIRTDYKNVWAEVGENLVKADGKTQYDILPILDKFLHNVSYDENNMAAKYYPLGKDAKVVVDPTYQFGQPVVEGTRIKTKSIYNLHLGGESEKRICNLYNISQDKVRDAIRFHTNAA
jgi:uncharacterized protein (DUF433 family)